MNLKKYRQGPPLLTVQKNKKNSPRDVLDNKEFKKLEVEGKKGKIDFFAIRLMGLSIGHDFLI
jgi:hypothetical protein